jgi:hypothetical protein
MSQQLQIAPEIVQSLDNEVGELRQLLTICESALAHYADQYCEGLCERSANCARFDDDCGGCLARRAIAAINGPRPIPPHDGGAA